MPTASAPSKIAADRGSSVPSRTTATSPRRTSRPFDSDTTSRSKSAGAASRPRSRIVRSSRLPSSRPTGAERFCACSAPTTCATPTPAACSACGRSSTVNSRSIAADDRRLGHALQPPEPPDDARVGEQREFRARQRRRRQHERDHGQVGRVEPRQHRFFHLRRQVVADGVDLVANLLGGLLQVLLVRELDDEHRETVQGGRLDLRHAADPGDRRPRRAR